MTIIGVCFLVLLPFFSRMPSPDQTEETLQEELVDSPGKQRKSISAFSNYIVALIFFFVVGQECTYGGWVSSYSVLQGFSSKEHATLYSSVYWISITFFRFCLAFVHGRASTKINVLFAIAILQSFLSLFIIYRVDPETGLIVSSIVFGLSNSVLFPLVLMSP